MLFTDIVYGPIQSRRLGTSLGINLMPRYSKACTFDCIYCECGFNPLKPADSTLPTLEQYTSALEQKMQALQTENIALDVLTFSGNGEPTLHPQFKQIIDSTIRLRDRYYPKAKVSVLSNSTQLYRQDVREALLKADMRILKLDSAIDTTIRLIDQPLNKELTVSRIVELLQLFEGDFILQTCFLRGTYQGNIIDNTTSEELEAYYQIVEKLRPKQIMIYVIDRATPVKTLEKIDRETMNHIADELRQRSFSVSVSC